MSNINREKYDYNSSCYFFDLRNSTAIIRKLSAKSTSENIEKLEFHSNMMQRIYVALDDILKKIAPVEFYINDTGDGHTCLIRGKNHAVLILKVACHMAEFVKPLLIEYNHELNLRNIALKLDFGIGMHSGGSVLIKNLELNKKFAYGIVINSASRVEAFTKTFPNIKLLFTGTFKINLENQIKNETGIIFAGIKNNIQQVTFVPALINDAKSNGHILYTIPESSWSQIASWFNNNKQI